MSDLTSKTVEELRQFVIVSDGYDPLAVSAAQKVIDELVHRLEEAQRERDEANEAHDAVVAAKALEEVLRGLHSEDDSTQLRAIIAEVKRMASDFRAKAGRKG